MGFLEKIAASYLEKYGNDLHNVTFVFPTRRACLYFMRALQKQTPKDLFMWAPPAYSFDEFIRRLSPLTVPDSLDLIFKLFSSYRDHVRTYQKQFEDFYPWGKMILSDFNDIDKYLVDTGLLFRTLKEFKGVEDFGQQEKTDIYERYTGFWDDLGKLYRHFNESLRNDGLAYEGMIYRETAETIADIVLGKKTRPEDDGFTPPLPEKTVFCGFNALTRSEETIIKHLLDVERGEIYWDVDGYFVEDVNQEAGTFFRKNMDNLKIKEPNWVEDCLSQEKEITLIGVQSKVSQAKVLGLKLQEMDGVPSAPDKAAVVLPDETLLFPVLNSLPQVVEQVNISLGFPLQQTPVYSLFSTLIEMQVRRLENRSASGEMEGFYHRDVLSLLNHPYIKPMDHDGINKFIDGMRNERLVFIKEEHLNLQSESLMDLFKTRGDSRELIDYFLHLADYIREFYTEKKPDIFPVDYEYIYHFYTLLSRLKDSLEAAQLVLGIRTFRQLFIDIVRNTNLPFTGEPLEGLQVMGMLETQNLDFSHLFILSLNEGHMPPGKSQQSFIPYDVRCIMKLPTYKDRDAIAAYHFYRLLKRSRHITLLYTTEGRGMEKSEKSRFIDQLLIEYADRNPKAKIKHQVIDFSFDTQRPKEIAVPKSPGIIDIMLKKSYSPSSLLTYLTCRLKFYFTYVLRLFEEDDLLESPDYKLIGDIIHNTLEELYKPYLVKGTPLTAGDFDAISVVLEKVLADIYGKELKTADISTGRNKIVFEVMRKFLEQFFLKERQQKGMTILMLEEKIENILLPFRIGKRHYKAKLGGTIDRLDGVGNNTYRLIDYKTGKVNPLKLDSVEDLDGPDAVKRKEVFQLLFYRYLLKRSVHKGNFKGDFRLGIYPFKRMYDSLSFVEIGGVDIIDDGMLQRFEEILIRLFRELFDEAEPFTQTEDEKTCQNCPYRDICCKEAAEHRG